MSLQAPIGSDFFVVVVTFDGCIKFLLFSSLQLLNLNELYDDAMDASSHCAVFADPLSKPVRHSDYRLASNLFRPLANNGVNILIAMLVHLPDVSGLYVVSGGMTFDFDNLLSLMSSQKDGFLSLPPEISIGL